MFGRLFLDHPRSVNESYFEHMLFAGGFALRLLGAGLAAFIHALIPCLFEKTAGNMIVRMHSKISNRDG
ncbi:MAG: hypothetical protein ACI9KK_001013 [Ascidiaceihabitans sp.]|jgi:hypothetical protein